MAGKHRQINLSHLDGVYDVTVHKAKPGARKMRNACKYDKGTPKVDSQRYDDARERMKVYGFDPNAPLPRGFFE